MGRNGGRTLRICFQVMKFYVCGQRGVHNVSPGIGCISGNSDVKGTGCCRVGHLWDKQLKPSCINMLGIGLTVGSRFGVKATDMYDRVVKPRALDEREPTLKVEEYLNSLRNYEKEGVPKGAGTESDEGFDLQRMSRLLLRLGDPLCKYPVLHVAGTKGKGSTVSFLSQILRAAGFRVGSYTSPHIRSLRERIICGTTGRPISTKAFNQLFDDVQATVHESVIAEAGALTHFEVLTALAFVHFAREQVDVAVIEAGLGGARDATNVVQASGLLAAVIVGIGEEHLEALGGSLESIALAKAGIIKHNRPVILGRQTESVVENLVRQVAASKNSNVLPGPNQRVVYKTNGICLDSFNSHQICDISIPQIASGDSAAGHDETWMIEDLKIPVLGAHQLDNVAAAIQTALCLRGQGFEISDSAIRLGVESTTISGRFQFLTPLEASKLGSLGSTVILDGAHTLGSGEALARTLRDVFPEEYVAMVVAMASDKDHQGFARAILEGTEPKIIVTTSVDVAGSLKRSTSSTSLKSSFTRAGKELNMTVLDGLESDHMSRSETHVLSSRASECTADSGEMRSQRTEQLLLVEEADSIQLAIAKAAQLILELNRNRPGVICITGSLHAVATAMSCLSIKE
ncbi:unnamed protein product [Calypogeia fissa]